LQKYLENSVRETRSATAAEEIIGIFLKDGLLFRDYQHKLNSTWFGSYQGIFQTMREIDRETEVTFRAVGLRHPDKIETLNQLYQQAISVYRLPELIDELKRDVLHQTLVNISERYTNALAERTDPNKVLAEMQREVNHLSNTEDGELSDPSQDVQEFMEYVEMITHDPSGAFGMMTDLDALDRLTTGFHRTDFIVVGARPSMGKSAFAIDLALRLTRNGYKVAIFSLEMSKRQIYFRMLANLMGVSLKVLRTGQLAKELLPQIHKHNNFLSQIYVDDARGISADYMADRMRRLKRTQGLDFVIVDYLQEIVEPGELSDTAGSALGRICRKLRAAAQECDCSVLGLSQIVRGVEDREDKRPGNSDLSGSTGIETSADVIAMLYRDEYYNKNSDKQGIIEVIFTKQRNGEVGRVDLYYDRTNQRFLNLDRKRIYCRETSRDYADH